MVKVGTLSCILLCTSFLFAGCKSDIHLSDTTMQDKNIVLEVDDSDTHILIEQVDSKNMVYDLSNNKTGDLGTYRKELKPVMNLNIPSEYKGNYKDLNPCTKENGVICTSPNTYNSDLETSLDFISYVQSSGWSPMAVYKTGEYMDIYYKKYNKYLRILVTNEEIKIFQNISKNLTPSWTYINERIK